jgi:hypothetical protein
MYYICCLESNAPTDSTNCYDIGSLLGRKNDFESYNSIYYSIYYEML